VLGRNPTDVERVVSDAAATAGARFVYAPDGVTTAATLVDGQVRVLLRTAAHDFGEVALSLRGLHQVDNAVVAARLLEELSAQQVLSVSTAAIRTALTDVVWPARLELLPWRGGHVLLDGAHNPAGARALASYVRAAYGRRLPFVVGAMKDKRIAEVLGALGTCASHLLCTAASSPRAAMPEELAALATAAAPGVQVQACARPMDALTAARELGDPVVAAGSLYLVGEIRDRLT
jgi:dihydrofolate synthase/folylpolyglutamate synthase